MVRRGFIGSLVGGLLVAFGFRKEEIKETRLSTHIYKPAMREKDFNGVNPEEKTRTFSVLLMIPVAEYHRNGRVILQSVYEDLRAEGDTLEEARDKFGFGDPSIPKPPWYAEGLIDIQRGKILQSFPNPEDIVCIHDVACSYYECGEAPSSVPTVYERNAI